jgi:two-component system, chemotaxis family, sensor kinase CheA
MSQDTIAEEMRIFLLESYELTDQMEQDLMQLERTPSDTALLNSVFRALHTIKGNSSFLALANLEGLCHKGEAILDKARSGVLILDPDVITLLLKLSDELREIFGSLEQGGNDEGSNVAALEKGLSQVLTGAH